MSGAAEEGVPPSDAVLFILVCFGCGIFIRLCLRWTRVPYTAMLLLWGVAIGFLQLANPMTVAFTNTLQLWLNMEPHLLLLIFLPIIGFSAAVSQEPHMLRKSWGQIMLLAWPGVVIQFLLIALCGKYFFPYNWSWPEAFLFGAMLSATDPVAVVAVLQEVGASQKLACVIDGESLMNDGSALVIFLLLQKIVEGEPVTVGGAIAQFCLLAVVGMLLGIAFGFATSWLLDNIFRDPTLTTVVTLVSAYSSYYTADRLVGASGLLAVVRNGFTMSLIGGRQITLRVEDAMHGFWGVLEWGANTILFVWVGIVLAIVLPPSHEGTPLTKDPIHLEPRDAGYVVVLYLWLQVARATLLMVCWIPFQYTGYPLSWRTAIIVMWGGLRGAVGMVMGLFIFLDNKIYDSSFKSYCIFYMGTMAFFTVLINGGTCKLMLQWLGFLSYTPEQLGTLTHVIEDMDEIREQQLKGLVPDEVLGEPEPDAVKVWSRLPTEAMLAQAAANTVRPGLNRSSPAYAAALDAGLDPQLLYDYRCRVLNMVKAHYAEVYDKHLLSTLQIRTLQSVTDAALDEAGDDLKDWKLLEPNCRLRGLPKLMQAWKFHRLSSTLVQAATYSQGLSNLQLLVGFIHAHRHAQDVLRQHIKAVEDHAHSVAEVTPQATSRKQGNPAGDGLQHPSPTTAAYLSDDIEGLRGGAEALAVLQESEQEVVRALALAEGITKSHPSLPAWLRSKQAAGEILTEQHAFLQHLGEAGLVQPREMLLLEDLMHDQFRSLLRANTGLSAAVHYSRARPPLNVLPLFDSLGDAEVEQLMKHCISQAQSQGSSAPRSRGLHWKVYYPEQVIAPLDSRIEHVVIVTKGSVRMRFPIVDGPHARTEEHTVVASVGDALGVCELMLGLPRMAEITADSMVQALLVPTATFMQLVSAVPGIRTRAWQATAAQLAAQHHHILGQHKQLAPLNMFFRNCTVERVKPGQVFEVPRTALLLTGTVKALLPLPADLSLHRGHSAPMGSWIPPKGGSSSSSGLSLNSLADGADAPAHGQNAADLHHQGSVDSSTGSDDVRRSSPAGGSPNSSSGNLLGRIWEHAEHRPLQQQEDQAAAAAAAARVSVRSEDAAVVSSPGKGSLRVDLATHSSDNGHANAQLLAAPAELPPGEFKCLTEAMVLQVPMGPEVPTDLQTTTYQAQVLSKGSIALDTSSISRSHSHGVGKGWGSDGDLATTGKVGTPLRNVLDRMSKMAGLTRTASDSVPSMPFLQRALASMRAQQQQAAQQEHSLRHGSGGATAAAAAVRTRPLRTVADVRPNAGTGRMAATEGTNGVTAGLQGSTAAAAVAAAEAAAFGTSADVEMGLGTAGVQGTEASPFVREARSSQGANAAARLATSSMGSSTSSSPRAVSGGGSGGGVLGFGARREPAAGSAAAVALPRAVDVVLNNSFKRERLRHDSRGLGDAPAAGSSASDSRTRASGGPVLGHSSSLTRRSNNSMS